MTRVLATSAHGPCSPELRVRARIPAPALEAWGVHVRPLPLFTTEEYASFQSGSLARKVTIGSRARRRLRRQADAESTAGVVWVMSRADMYPRIALERRLIGDRRFVYDVDDAIWHDSQGGGGAHPLAFLKGSRRKAAWLAGRADHVIAGNVVLAEWLAELARTVTVIPSLVDTDGIPVRRHGEGPGLVIGWVGSPTTAAYLEDLVGPLERLARAIPAQVRLLVVGGRAPRVRGVEIAERPWSEANERDALERMDIGVMPLPDNSWTRGKCAYKAVQYMAAGVPVVASDVGITAEVVGGDGGRIYRDDNGAFEALRELSLDPVLRGALGESGRRRAEQSFSVQSWAPRLAAVLRGEA
jgi:glycosyltransferase involved in cell wall biosynthesis